MASLVSYNGIDKTSKEGNICLGQRIFRSTVRDRGVEGGGAGIDPRYGKINTVTPRHN